jgi:hypothetical protein
MNKNILIIIIVIIVLLFGYFVVLGVNPLKANFCNSINQDTTLEEITTTLGEPYEITNPIYATPNYDSYMGTSNDYHTELVENATIYAFGPTSSISSGSILITIQNDTGKAIAKTCDFGDKPWENLNSAE